jgi:citrate synthase
VTEKGLREVIAADTVISDIDGEQGRLWYVGYDIADLAEHCTFEEVIYLLHNRKLPNQDELDELNEFLVDNRELSPFLTELLSTLAQQASPMSMLRTSISAASAYDPDGWDDSPEAEYRKAMRLIAKTPALIAYYHRLRTGQDLIPPNPKLPHAANFLWMLLGDEPSQEDAEALDTTFTLYADHTMNASTFTARIIASTLSDMFSAITGAIGALKGPLHGGANEEAMKAAEEVGSPANAAAYVARPAGAAREDHGVRTRRLPDHGPASHRAEAARTRVGRASRGCGLVGDLRGDAGHRVRAEAAVAQRRPLRRRRLPRTGHPHRPDDADLRPGAHGGLDRARARAVRRQQGDPSRLHLRGPARPGVGSRSTTASLSIIPRSPARPGASRAGSRSRCFAVAG